MGLKNNRFPVVMILAVVLLFAGFVFIPAEDTSTTQDIACYVSSDCGVNGFIDQFCSDDKVKGTYITYHCHNDGKTTSYCTNSTEIKKIEECSYGCSEGMCLNKCGNGVTETDEQCDDGNNLDRDGCNSLCEVESNSCSTDASLKINFILTDIKNNGVLDEKVFVGENAEEYSANVSIPLSQNGEFIIDSALVSNVPGISIQRLNGALRFLLYGEYTDGSEEILAAEILLNDAVISGFENDKINANSKLEDQGDGNYHLGNSDKDEVFAETNTSRATWFSTVSGGSDGFFLEISCQETNETPSEEEPVCRTNSDCGTDGFVEEPFCSNDNVFQNFVSYHCRNDNTQNSFCETNTEAKKIEECSFMCTNGECAETGAICGNGIDESGEQCDDGNTNNGDGCSSSCALEQNQTSLNVQIISPAEGQRFNFTRSIPLNFIVTGPADACFYNVDNGANITLPNCTNTTFNTVFGNHIITVFASHHQTQTVSDSNSFTVIRAGEDDEDDSEDEDRDNGNSASIFGKNTYLNNTYYTDADRIYLNPKNSKDLSGTGTIIMNKPADKYNNNESYSSNGFSWWIVIALLIIIIIIVIVIISILLSH